VLTLSDASRALQRLLVAQTRSSGLGLFEYLVLSRAADGDGVIPGDVGRSVGLSTSTMTGVSNRLEEQELIRRHPHPTDRRLLLLKATPKGRRVCERTLGPLWSALIAEATLLEPSHRVAVIGFLERVIPLLNERADLLSRDSGRITRRASGPRRARGRSAGESEQSQKGHESAP
jgi:DNA-binding MarR family transcriptional regulator